MDYLVFVVRELLLVAKDLRQKHYESGSSGMTTNDRGSRYSYNGVDDIY